jgi:hypothetical protein
VGTISFLLLVFSGVEILMVHPRLYWGKVGNDLTPALFELPISRNYHHGGWTGEGIAASCPWLLSLFFGAQSARTLHFFCAILLILFLVVHVVMIIRSGFRKHLRAMTIES